MIQWGIAEMGKRYTYEDWELLATDDAYYLTDLSRPLFTYQISAEHGLYYAIDVANGFIEGKSVDE